MAALAAVASMALPVLSASAQVPEQSKTAAQIFADSLAAMSKVKDFHVSGKFVQGTQDVALNIVMSHTGGGGSMQYEGATIDLVVTAKDMYMKADTASWVKLAGGQSAGKEVAALLAGRWLKVPITSSSEFSSFSSFTFSNKFVGKLTSEAPTAGLHKLGEGKWNGKPAIVLADNKGSHLYIAASGPPYIIGMTGKSAVSGSMTFNDFGDAPLPAVPVSAVSLPGF